MLKPLKYIVVPCLVMMSVSLYAAEAKGVSNRVTAYSYDGMKDGCPFIRALFNTKSCTPTGGAFIAYPPCYITQASGGWFSLIGVKGNCPYSGVQFTCGFINNGQPQGTWSNVTATTANCN